MYTRATLILAILAMLLSCAANELIDSNRFAEPMPDDVPHSYQLLGRPQDFSYGASRRLSVSIEIPLGRSKEEVEATLRKAALDLDAQERPDAIMVFGYRPGDDHKAAYTVGRAIYAPNGKWEDADKRAPKQFAIDLGTIYFETGTVPKAYRPGNTVALRSADGDDIGISRTAQSWHEKDMIVRVPAGPRPRSSSEESSPSRPICSWCGIRWKSESGIGPSVDGSRSSTLSHPTDVRQTPPFVPCD